MPEKKPQLPIKEQLKILLKIQEYDSQLLELQMRKSFFPDLLKQLKEEIKNLEAEFKEKSDRLTEVKKELDLMELTLKQEEQALKDSQDKLLKVSTNKEYDAVQMEIETHEEKIAEAEEKIIVLLDEQKSLEKEVAELEERLKKTKELNESRIAEIKKNSQEIDQIIEKIKAEKAHLEEKVSMRLLNKYRQIRQGQQGVAVVPVVDRACGGCHQALPPQRIQEIRAGKLVICESCGRILVDPESLKGDEDKEKKQ